MTVALSLKPAAFADDCGMARVVISRFAAPTNCRDNAAVVDRADLRVGGAHALYLEVGSDGEPELRVETAYPANRRAFMPPAGQ